MIMRLLFLYRLEKCKRILQVFSIIETRILGLCLRTKVFKPVLNGYARIKKHVYIPDLSFLCVHVFAVLMLIKWWKGLKLLDRLSSKGDMRWTWLVFSGKLKKLCKDAGRGKGLHTLLDCSPFFSSEAFWCPWGFPRRWYQILYHNNIAVLTLACIAGEPEKLSMNFHSLWHFCLQLHSSWL